KRIETLLAAHGAPGTARGNRGTVPNTAVPETHVPSVGPDNAETSFHIAALHRGRRELREYPGEHIGPYKLLQPLGEGGMGTVWVAEQQEPVLRRVALKLIKAGLDSAVVLRRFEAERQALALMDHANIAKVLDAGATAAGRPYFVMELVQGVPIT